MENGKGKKRIGFALFLLIVLGTALASAKTDVLAGGWWNASVEELEEAKEQIEMQLESMEAAKQKQEYLDQASVSQESNIQQKAQMDYSQPLEISVLDAATKKENENHFVPLYSDAYIEMELDDRVYDTTSGIISLPGNYKVLIVHSQNPRNEEINISWHVKTGDGIRVFIYPRFDPNRKSSCR